MILRASVLNPRGKARRKTMTYPNGHPPTPLKVMLDPNFLNIMMVLRTTASLLAGSALSPHSKARKQMKTYPKPPIKHTLPP